MNSVKLEIQDITSRIFAAEKPMPCVGTGSIVEVTEYQPQKLLNEAAPLNRHSCKQTSKQPIQLSGFESSSRPERCTNDSTPEMYKQPSGVQLICRLSNSRCFQAAQQRQES